MIIAAYLIEAGLLLIIVPWTASWHQNYFAMLLPALGQVMANEYVRGAISGIGLVTTFAGVWDLSAAVAARQARRSEPSARPGRLL